MCWHDCKVERSTRSPNNSFCRFLRWQQKNSLKNCSQDGAGCLLPPLLGLLPVLQEGVVVLAASQCLAMWVCRKTGADLAKEKIVRMSKFPLMK